MITAESVVKKCLESGYSLESLRQLAESHGQPLYGEILSVLETMAANGEIPAAADDSGPCETAAYPVVGDGSGEGFFIGAEAPESEPEGVVVDFDVMAGLAASEESVAEIFVGGEPEAAGEASVAEAVCEEMEPVRQEMDAEAGVDMTSEISADYIPEAEVEPSDIESEKRRLGEAQAAIAELPQAMPEITREMAQETLPEPVPERETVSEEPRQESRRERRRRERAEKKKQKKSTASAQAAALPEIVLTRSEGTETMSVAEEAAEEAAETMQEEIAAETPEEAVEETIEEVAEETREEVAEEVREEVAEEVAEETAPEPESLLPVPVAEIPQAEAEEETVSEADPEPEQAEAPRVGEPMSLLTPIDVIEDDSSILAKAEEEEVEEEEARENNVILFNEMFPVFAGTSFEEEDAEEEVIDFESSSFLHMLPQPEEVAEAEEPQAATEETTFEEMDAAEEAKAPEEQEQEAAEAFDIFEELNIFAENDEYNASTEILETEIAEIENAAETEAAKEAAEAAAALAEAEREAELEAARAAEAVRQAEAARMRENELKAKLEADLEAELEREREAFNAREAALRAELEEDFQTRLDAFAARILDAQSLAAASETKAQEKGAELAAAAAELASLRDQIDAGAAENTKLAGKLEQAKAATLARDEDIHRLRGMKEEHERLYLEFEDLRKAYNEVVTDVMPTLQTERDDLALTVERQCANETALRDSLGSVRKRLTAGYALAGAACLAFVALPVATWLKSEKDDRDMALERQQITELEKTLQSEVRQNVNSRNAIVELENEVEMARAQILDLQGKNKELTRVASSFQAPRQDSRSKDLAVFAPDGSAAGSRGVPTRTSAMALQGTAMRPGEKLRVNEVRDPAGSIEQAVAMNRERQRGGAEGGARMASAQSRNSTRPIAMSAVARQDGKNAAKNSVKPSKKAPKAWTGEVLAKVKKGEGVAQVVYRELGTWDPEVISWVIHENKIPLDKRGNPRIHPDQTLRLPQGGRIGQSASR